jgi:hypothetical protein
VGATGRHGLLGAQSRADPRPRDESDDVASVEGEARHASVELEMHARGLTRLVRSTLIGSELLALWTVRLCVLCAQRCWWWR